MAGSKVGASATIVPHDAIPVMTALHYHGGLTFLGAREVNFSELYPEWATFTKVACVIPISSMPTEWGFSLQNRIEIALHSHLQEEKVTSLMHISSNSNSAVERFWVMKNRIKIVIYIKKKNQEKQLGMGYINIFFFYLLIFLSKQKYML